MPSGEGTLAQPGEYDWTVRLLRRCGLMSTYFDHLLWPPCVADADIIFLPCGFYLSFFFPRLISAVGDWMSTILPHSGVVLVRIQNAGLKCAARGSLKIQDAEKSPSLGTIAPLCRAISSQLRHVLTIGKNLLSTNMSSTCPHNIVNFQPINSWDRFDHLGHPSKFQLVSCLGSVTAWHLVVGVSWTLWRWTEGASYVRQGDHHVGHWPTFLVIIRLPHFTGM